MIVISAAILICLAWASLYVFDWLIKARKVDPRKWSLNPFKTKNEPYANNFMLRFFYELFLEFCICALVNVALRDTTDFSPTLQWILSIVVLVAIFVYIGWLISLFFFKGPYLEGFYTNGSLLSSFW